MTLLIGIGNPDRGDDGAGPAVTRRLAGRPGLSIETNVGDTLALLDAWDGAGSVILIDAAAPAGNPGRIRRLDGGRELPRDLALGSTHAFGLAEAVELARALGRLPGRLTIYAIEGARFDPGARLSPEVAAAVADVADRILSELPDA
jgi:hydrogenase maturation protease